MLRQFDGDSQQLYVLHPRHLFECVDKNFDYDGHKLHLEGKIVRECGISPSGEHRSQEDTANRFHIRDNCSDVFYRDDKCLS